MWAPGKWTLFHDLLKLCTGITLTCVSVWRRSWTQDICPESSCPTFPSGIHQSATVSLLGWWTHPEHSVSRGWFWIPLVSPHVLDWACELIPISWPLITSLYPKTSLRWFLKVIYSEVGSQNTLTPTGNSRLCTCNMPDLGWHNRGAFWVPVFGWFPATKNKYGIF